MSEQNTSPHEAKVLADLLALTLAESDPEAEAAISAIRRRAARDGVTGGAVKALIQRLMSEMRPETLDPQSADLERAVADLNWVVEDQRRELEETRHARQVTEHAISETRRTNASLADRIGGLDRARRATGAIGFAVGIACSIGAFIGVGLLRGVHLGAPAPNGVPGQQASLNKAAEAELDDFLRNCFLASVNSLGAGSSFDLHLLIDVDANSRITGVRTAPSQAGAVDEDTRQFGELMVRTLGSGSCGKLPLPASLQGQANHLDLWLPR